MTDKEIEVIVKPIFTEMFNSNFSACEYGIKCYKKGMEYQGIKELTIENANLIKRITELEKENAELKEINGRTLGQLNLANGELIIENEKLKKENAELKDQIEKMKLCQNCRFEVYDDMEEPCRNCSRLLGDIKRKGTSDKWEIVND